MEQKPQQKNTNKKGWKLKDEQQLIVDVSSGLTINEIADKHDRFVGDVLSKLTAIGCKMLAIGDTVENVSKIVGIDIDILTAEKKIYDIKQQAKKVRQTNVVLGKVEKKLTKVEYKKAQVEKEVNVIDDIITKLNMIDAKLTRIEKHLFGEDANIKK